MISLYEVTLLLRPRHGMRVAQREFFGRVVRGIEVCRDAEDLAGPFMELSTSAFLGFQYSPAASLLIDRILASAQTLALTLSADADAPS